MSNLAGQFVISLDFELYWGVRHHNSVKPYMSNLLGARAAVPALLDLFTEYGIHATWATVGFLFFERTGHLREFVPRDVPQYTKQKLNPYVDLPSDNLRDSPTSIFFAPSLIRRIAETSNQEVASHTFSHYFCLEEGQDIETFRQDLMAARAAAEHLGLEVRSLVFPQNQFRREFLRVCAEVGIIAYRGNQESWIYEGTAGNEQGYGRRLGRLLDSYLTVSSRNFHPLPSLAWEVPVNVPASRFLRPYSSALHRLEPLRLRRIEREMSMAAKRGMLYHLWWHPHNFGVNTTENLAFVRKILDHYESLNRQFGFQSMNMREVAESCMRAVAKSPAQKLEEVIWP